MDYINYHDFQLKKSAVCLGKFDGLHMGHQKLIKYCLELKSQGLHSVVFTFLMNPRLLKKEEEFSLIYTEEEKKEIFRELGVDTIVSYPFNKEMFAMDPEDFVRDILMEKLDTKAVIVGTDFRFGHNRSGDVALLKKLGEIYGFQVKAFDKITYKDAIISSSRIRQCLKDGQMEEACRMLGRPYSIWGQVLHGRKLGRTLGMPTINMVPEESKLLPPNGVYASKTWIDGNAYPGISNIGVKPTVGTQEHKLIETFIFDYEGDLYGRNLKVDLYIFERPEKKFRSILELKQHMEEDTAFGKQYFNENPSI